MKKELTNEEHDDRLNQGLGQCNRCGNWQNAEKEMYWQGEEDVETNEIISPYIAVCNVCFDTLRIYFVLTNKQLGGEEE